jgi:hypothetical protein
MIQYVVRSPEALVEALDGFVDGARFKSRNQLINVILTDWIAWERFPMDESDAERLEPGERIDWITQEKHQRLRGELLGEEIERYRQQNADVLDGEWQKMKQAERMAQIQAQFDREQALKASLKAELLAELRAELGGAQGGGSETTEPGPAKASGKKKAGKK